MNKFFGILCLVAAAYAAPSAEADAEADPQFYAGHLGVAGHLAAAPVVEPIAYHAAAPSCVVTQEILVTQTCTPRAENVCTTQEVITEEIEYEKICKDVVDTLCDHAHAGYAGHIVKREADAEAEADAQFYGYAGHAAIAPLAHAAPIAHHVAPVAHAVAHSAVATVRHACREVTTTHCVDNPKVKVVPVEVEHCHTITKVDCADVENAFPNTTCEAVETTHTVGLGVHPAAYVAAAPAW